MRRLLLIPALLGLALLASCSDSTSHTRAVYMLLDTSGTYTKEMAKANAIINYLLGTLNPGDSFAIAKIDSGSFSEKDIVAKATFDTRPSHSNAQKRVFRKRVDDFVKTIKSSSYTDITGGILQGIEYLKETGAGKKIIIIFSDLEEDLPQGHIRNIPFKMDGIEVVAINVTKLRSDNIDPREYMKRLKKWENKVVTGKGVWRVVNDLNRLENILPQ